MTLHSSQTNPLRKNSIIDSLTSAAASEKDGPGNSGHRVVLRTEGVATKPSFCNGDHYTVFNKSGEKKFRISWGPNHRLAACHNLTYPDGSGFAEFVLEPVE